MKVLYNITALLGNKMNLISNGYDSYIGRNEYFCLNVSHKPLAVNGKLYGKITLA